MYQFNGAVITKAAEMLPNIAMWRIVVRQVAPCTTGSQLIEDGIPYFTQRICTRAACSASFGRWKD